MSEHTTELENCPFCNGAARMATEYDEDGIAWHYIKCCKCGARSRGKWHSAGNDCPQFYAEVREDWNRRSYATALCQQGERDAKDAALADGFDGSAIRPGWNHTTILLWYDTEEKARAAHRVIVGLVDTALSTSEGKTE